MTSQRTAGAGSAAVTDRRRSQARVVEATDEHPLGDVRGQVRASVAAWLRSPALDYYALLVVGALLIGVGLVMVLSSSSVANIAAGKSPYAGFARQLVYAVIGVVALVVAQALPLKVYRSMGFLWALLGIGFFLQFLVVATPLGVNVNGNQNWLKIGPVQGQPAEFLKLALALWLGGILAAKRHRLRDTRHLLFPILPVLLLALGLVILGDDLGTMMMMAFLAAGCLWAAGVPKRWFLLAGGAGAAGILALAVTSPNRMARIVSWRSGDCDGAAACFQSDNGLMALAEGGWWGVGLGASRQKWGRIPHADNDYIFAVIGEEFGLVGTLGVLGLFLLFGLVVFRMSSRLREPMAQIAIAGISCWILGQALVNMMVVAAVLPVLGVPLPFVSAGGSALVVSMLALGVLLAFARSEPGADATIRAKGGFARRSASVAAAGRPARPRSAKKRSQ